MKNQFHYHPCGDYASGFMQQRFTVRKFTSNTSAEVSAKGIVTNLTEQDCPTFNLQGAMQLLPNI
jgi:hypothetical protein